METPPQAQLTPDDQAENPKPKRKNIIRSQSGKKRTLLLGQPLVMGGFSLLFEGELVGEKHPVAVKVLKNAPSESFTAVRKLFKRKGRQAAAKEEDRNQSKVGEASNRGKMRYLSCSRTFCLRKKKNVEREALASETKPDELPKLKPWKALIRSCLTPFGQTKQFFFYDQETLLGIQPEQVSTSKDIRQEITALQNFQSNSFVVRLMGTCKLLRETWIVTEFCSFDVYQVARLSRRRIKYEERGILALHLMAPILDALLFIHQQDYIHRDIKPHNILVDREGVPKLIDFGLCVKLSPETNSYTDDEAPGSDLYIAPETVRKLPVGPKCDAFAFAVTFLALSGLHPIDLFRRVGDGTIRDLYRQDNGDVDKFEQKLKKKAKDWVCWLGKEKWGPLANDFANMVSFDPQERESLIALADSSLLFKEALEDWRKFPCDDSELSKEFLYVRPLLLLALEDMKTMDINI